MWLERIVPERTSPRPTILAKMRAWRSPVFWSADQLPVKATTTKWNHSMRARKMSSRVMMRRWSPRIAMLSTTSAVGMTDEVAAGSRSAKGVLPAAVGYPPPPLAMEYMRAARTIHFWVQRSGFFSACSWSFSSSGMVVKLHALTSPFSMASRSALV